MVIVIGYFNGEALSKIYQLKNMYKFFCLFALVKIVCFWC